MKKGAEEMTRQVMKLRDQGQTYKEIAEAVGCSTKHVENIVSKNKVHGVFDRAFNFPHITHARRFGAKSED
tara:strand:- start:13086 stop:13298 length:213 start_codon:yes stop_codon:yes gene_type:complete